MKYLTDHPRHVAHPCGPPLSNLGGGYRAFGVSQWLARSGIFKIWSFDKLTIPQVRSQFDKFISYFPRRSPLHGPTPLHICDSCL